MIRRALAIVAVVLTACTSPAPQQARQTTAPSPILGCGLCMVSSECTGPCGHCVRGPVAGHCSRLEPIAGHGTQPGDQLCADGVCVDASPGTPAAWALGAMKDAQLGAVFDGAHTILRTKMGDRALVVPSADGQVYEAAVVEVARPTKNAD